MKYNRWFTWAAQLMASLICSENLSFSNLCDFFYCQTLSGMQSSRTSGRIMTCWLIKRMDSAKYTVQSWVQYCQWVRKGSEAVLVSRKGWAERSSIPPRLSTVSVCGGFISLSAWRVSDSGLNKISSGAVLNKPHGDGVSAAQRISNWPAVV